MPDNLFADLPAPGTADEAFSTLLVEPGLVIERIVSTGQASPPGFWYEQPEAEWVLLVSGEALLRFEDESEPRRLLPEVADLPESLHQPEFTRRFDSPDSPQFKALAAEIERRLDTLPLYR